MSIYNLLDGIVKFIETEYGVSVDYEVKDLTDSDKKYLVVFSNPGWSIKTSQQVLKNVYTFTGAYMSMNNCKELVDTLSFYIEQN